MADMIPRFAVVGRVNKGKSTLIATLTEDDSVAISPRPRTTQRCQLFPVRIDDQVIMEFIDTPGFENARLALERMTALRDSGLNEREALEAFHREISGVAEFEDEYELLTPILNGAGIIYVVDASRPYRDNYEAEMEILSWTLQPRMVVINYRHDSKDFRDQWRIKCRKWSAVVREFNAAKARPADRFYLLEDLLHITDVPAAWRPNIRQTIKDLHDEWCERIRQLADVISDLLIDCLTYRINEMLPKGISADQFKQKVEGRYHDALRRKERTAHLAIQQVYRHRRLIDEGDPLETMGDLFSTSTWSFLGLTRRQLIVSGGLSGAAVGSLMDMAAGGGALGLPTAIGAAVGVGAALWAQTYESARIPVKMPWLDTKFELPLAGSRITIGPHRNPNFGWILLDRALIHCRTVMHRTHGDRTNEMPGKTEVSADEGSNEKPKPDSIVSAWNDMRRKQLAELFSLMSKQGRKGRSDIPTDQYERLNNLLTETLNEIAGIET